MFAQRIVSGLLKNARPGKRYMSDKADFRNRILSLEKQQKILDKKQFDLAIATEAIFLLGWYGTIATLLYTSQES